MKEKFVLCTGGTTGVEGRSVQPRYDNVLQLRNVVRLRNRRVTEESRAADIRNLPSSLRITSRCIRTLWLVVCLSTVPL
jgi:hypothetical protein